MFLNQNKHRWKNPLFKRCLLVLLLVTSFIVSWIQTPLAAVLANGGSKVEMNAEVVTPTHLFTNVKFTGCTVPFAKVILYDNDEDRIYVQQNVDEKGQFDRLAFVLDRIEDAPKNFTLYAEYKGKRSNPLSYSFQPTTYDAASTIDLILPPMVDQEYEEIREDGEISFFAFGCPEHAGAFFFQETAGDESDALPDPLALSSAIRSQSNIQSFDFFTDPQGNAEITLRKDLDPGVYEVYAQQYGNPILGESEEVPAQAQPSPEEVNGEFVAPPTTIEEAVSSMGRTRFSQFSEVLGLTITPAQIFSDPTVIGGAGSTINWDPNYFIDWLIILLVIIILMLAVIMTMLYYVSRMEKHQQLLISHLGAVEEVTLPQTGVNSKSLVRNFWQGLGQISRPLQIPLDSSSDLEQGQQEKMAEKNEKQGEEMTMAFSSVAKGLVKEGRDAQSVEDEDGFKPVHADGSDTLPNIKTEETKAETEGIKSISNSAAIVPTEGQDQSDLAIKIVQNQPDVSSKMTEVSEIPMGADGASASSDGWESLEREENTDLSSGVSEKVTEQKEEQNDGGWNTLA